MGGKKWWETCQSTSWSTTVIMSLSIRLIHTYLKPKTHTSTLCVKGTSNFTLPLSLWIGRDILRILNGTVQWLNESLLATEICVVLKAQFPQVGKVNIKIIIQIALRKHWVKSISLAHLYPTMQHTYQQEHRPFGLNSFVFHIFING